MKGLYFLEGSLRLGVEEISIGEWERLTRDGSGNLQRQLDGWRGWAAFDCLFQPRQWLYIKKRADTKRSSEVKKKPFESQTRALMAVEHPGVLCGRLPLYQAVLSKRDSFPSPPPSRFSFQEMRKKSPSRSGSLQAGSCSRYHSQTRRKKTTDPILSVTLPFLETRKLTRASKRSG